MKKYWWMLMLLISFAVYDSIMLYGEWYFPSKTIFTQLIASFLGIFLVFWFFRGYFSKGYFSKKNKRKKIKK
jgi:uncharacterized membrane protein YdjX (TVP38/TMEM64 family)